jgi:hypothetical protein
MQHPSANQRREVHEVHGVENYSVNFALRFERTRAGGSG